MRRFVLLSVLACACGGGANGPESGADMSSFAGDLAGETADAASCALVTLSPMMAVAPATIVATAADVGGAAPTWSVITPDGEVTPMPLDSTGLRVQLTATTPGTYTFQVQFSTGGPCPGSNSLQVVAPQALQTSYRVRLTPPGSSGLPQQDRILTVEGKTPQSDADFYLSTGTTLGGVLRGPAGALAGEAQLFPQSGPQVSVAIDASGSFSLPIQIDASYRLVLIPSDPTLAPRVLGPMDGASLLAQPYTVDSGVIVSGLVRDPAMHPLAGASVVLRADVLPSGLGVAASDGSYSLHAEPGAYSLATAVGGWPDISLAGISLTAGGATLGIDHATVPQTVPITVVHADGITVVSGALLALRSRSIAGAATVTVNGVAQAATGVMRAQGTSASDGSYAVSLPSATYDVLLTPPAGSSEGATGIAVAVSGPGPVTVALAAQLPLTGVVSDAADAPLPAATLRLFAADGTFVRAATTDGSGHFTIALDAGVPVDLEIDPPDAAALASVRVHLGSTDGTLGGVLPSTLSLSLPAGLPIDGTVRGPSGAALADVAIDLLCLSCGDPTPIAHASTGATGAYRLAVPDPGSLEVDGGADGS